MATDGTLTQCRLRRLLGGLGGRAGKHLGLNGLSVPEIWHFEVGVLIGLLNYDPLAGKCIS